MSEDKTWLLAPITARTTKKALDAMVSAMPPEYRGDTPDGSYTLPGPRKADLRKFVEDARARYWNDQQAPGSAGSRTTSAPPTPPQDVFPPKGPRRRKPAPRRKVTADLCEIPASECNAFLRSLPREGEET